MQQPEQNLESLLRVIVAALGRKTLNPEIAYDAEKMEFTLVVNPHDQGRFIGKKGIVIWSLQTIFWFAGINEIQHTVGLALKEPADPITDRRAMPFRAEQNWDRTKIVQMMDAIVNSCFIHSMAQSRLEENDSSSATIHISAPSATRSTYSDPDLSEAIKVVVRAAGMAQGANIDTKITWK